MQYKAYWGEPKRVEFNRLCFNRLTVYVLTIPLMRKPFEFNSVAYTLGLGESDKITFTKVSH